jgi:hypothetical protein
MMHLFHRLVGANLLGGGFISSFNKGVSCTLSFGRDTESQ